MSADDGEPRRDEPQDEWLEALRGAWQHGPAPAPDRSLADEDATTQAAVRWVRDAWLALPVPAAQAPRPAPHAAPPLVVHPRWRRVAVAAALLLALGVPLLVFAARRAAESRTHGGRLAAEETGPPPAVAPGPQPPPPPAAATPEPGPQVAAVDEHHLELRSGPVRLYLITDSPPSTDEVPR